MRRIFPLIPLALLLLHAQQTGAKGKRKALVIGNAVYKKLPPINTATRDARAVGDAISTAGFSLAISENADKKQLTAAIDGFLAKLGPADTVFIYYSGYAVQSEGENMLLPTSFNPKDPEAIDSEGYSLRRLQTALAKKQAGLKIIVLDAAYTSPELSQLAITPGLAAPFVDKETVVALPTQPGRTVTPSPSQKEGLFTAKFLAALQRPGLTPEQLFEDVAKAVRTETKGDEAPAKFADVLETFYFRDPLPVEPVKKIETSVRNPKDGLTYQSIPAGSFSMGCVPGDKECAGDETNHKVTLSREFWMSNTEVPVSAYRVYAARANVRVPLLEMLDKKNQKRLKQNILAREDAPVINVTWQEARNFCAASGGRLPKEAEWEYAARGGAANQIYPWGNVFSRDQANAQGMGGIDSFLFGAPVNSFPQNGFNLFHMSGNVWEWCEDFYDPSYSGKPGAEHAARGGSFDSEPPALRSSARGHFPSLTARKDLGFRCVMDQRPAGN